MHLTNARPNNRRILNFEVTAESFSKQNTIIENSIIKWNELSNSEKSIIKRDTFKDTIL